VLGPTDQNLEPGNGNLALVQLHAPGIVLHVLVTVMSEVGRSNRSKICWYIRNKPGGWNHQPIWIQSQS